MAFSILYWTYYISGTKKLSRTFEVAVQSDHVLKKRMHKSEAQFNHICVKGVTM